MFKQGDKVKLKRDIYRWSFVTGKGYRENVLYAKEGEVGEITEIFHSAGTKIVHAKVLIENQIKTFRISSIEKI